MNNEVIYENIKNGIIKTLSFNLPSSFKDILENKKIKDIRLRIETEVEKVKHTCSNCGIQEKETETILYNIDLENYLTYTEIPF